MLESEALSLSASSGPDSTLDASSRLSSLRWARGMTKTWIRGTEERSSSELNRKLERELIF